MHPSSLHDDQLDDAMMDEFKERVKGTTQAYHLNPATGLVYIPTLEQGMVLLQNAAYSWQAGEVNYGNTMLLDEGLPFYDEATRALAARAPAETAEDLSEDVSSEAETYSSETSEKQHHP